VILEQGLAGTAPLWPDVQLVYGWVHRAAQTLKNLEGFHRPLVQRRLRGLLGAMARHRAKAGILASAVDHFLKVSRSYWPGLFHCYDIADLPRTNNDLEHFFGVARYQERRSTGRKRGSPFTVVRGPVRLVAAVATRVQTFAPKQLAPRSIPSWQKLRAALAEHQEARASGRRFRRDPAGYLAKLEAQWIKLTLPP
jgi:hypothetical protein